MTMMTMTPRKQAHGTHDICSHIVHADDCDDDDDEDDDDDAEEDDDDDDDD